MSRIGRKPVIIPDGVTVSINGNVVSAKGPRGEMNQWFNDDFVEVELQGKSLVVKKRDVKKADAMQGLYRSLLYNLVEGVSKGFSKELVIEGIGYKATVKGRELVLSVGYSHDIVFRIPDGITVETDKRGVNLKVSGVSKQLVGAVASKIRSFRKPEPYKGKGIRYADEHVRRKAGKTAKK